MMTTESFKDRFNKITRLRNIADQELHEKTGIPYSSLSQYHSGHTAPKSDRIYKLAQAIGISPAWLSGFDVPMTEEEEKDEKYYIDNEARQLAEFLYKNEGHRALFQAVQNVKAKDLAFVQELIEKLSSID